MKDNKKLSKLLSKRFERSVYWNEYKTKTGNNDKRNVPRHFHEWNFFRVRRLFVLVYLNQLNSAKRFKARKYLPKGIVNNYNVIINWKNFSDQVINSDIKQYEEIRRLTKGQAEDYTTACLLNYDYTKNH